MTKPLMTSRIYEISEELKRLTTVTAKDIEANKKKLARLEKEVERQHKVQSALFVALLLAVGVSLVSVAMSFRLMANFASVEKQIDNIDARTTALTAEVRGIGGETSRKQQLAWNYCSSHCNVGDGLVMKNTTKI